MRQSARRGLMLAVVGAVLLPALARAESPEFGRRGWSIGVHILSDNVGAEDEPPNPPANAFFVEETGGGAAIHVGYAFTPTFALRFGIAVARHDTSRDEVELAHATATIEAHFRFLAGQRAQPYLVAGIGGSALNVDSGGIDSEATGGMALAGAGVLYHLSPNLALDFAARVEFINWDEVKTSVEVGGETVSVSSPVDEDGSAAKVMLGLVVNF